MPAPAPLSVALSVTAVPCSTLIDGPDWPPPESVVVSVEALPKPPTGGDSSEKYVEPPGGIAGEKLTTPEPVENGPNARDVREPGGRPLVAGDRVFLRPVAADRRRPRGT